MRRSSYQRLWHGTLSMILFVGIWYIASITGLFGRISPEYSMMLLPSPVKVLDTIVEITSSGYLLKHLSISLVRVIIGFAIAVIIGLPLSLAMSKSQVVDNFLQPIVRIFSPIPGVAWVPLAILWFGLGNRAAIFIIIMGSIFPIMTNTIQGVRDVDPILVDAARTMGAKPRQVLLRVILPSLIPYLVTGFRIGFGFAWRVVIAAEMVGVPNGLGYMLGVGRSTGRTDITIVTMVCLGVIMLIAEQLFFEPLDKRTRLWRKTAMTNG